MSSKWENREILYTKNHAYDIINKLYVDGFELKLYKLGAKSGEKLCLNIIEKQFEIPIHNSYGFLCYFIEKYPTDKTFMIFSTVFTKNELRKMKINKIVNGTSL